MEELKVFLLQRDVPEEFINRMMDEKVHENYLSRTPKTS